MDPAFEDLAEQEDIQTAKFAAKRLEYHYQQLITPQISQEQQQHHRYHLIR